MEEEHGSILYFYQQDEEALKRHRWNKAKLMSFELEDREEGVQLYVCGIPEFYCGRKGWEQEKLKECVEEILDKHRADTYFLSQAVSKKLKVQRKLPPPFLLKKVLEANSCWENLMVIGCDSSEDEWGEEGRFQRESGLEEEQALLYTLLKQYLPRINRITIVTDISDAYEEMAEWFYTEYGIPTSYVKKTKRTEAGRRKTAVLDCREGYEPLSAFLPVDAVYIDFWSDERKEELLRRENPGISYLSPVKFLDTLLKNRYNTLVNQNNKSLPI